MIAVMPIIFFFGLVVCTQMFTGDVPLVESIPHIGNMDEIDYKWVFECEIKHFVSSNPEYGNIVRYRYYSDPPQAMIITDGGSGKLFYFELSSSNIMEVSDWSDEAVHVKSILI